MVQADVLDETRAWKHANRLRSFMKAAKATIAPLPELHQFSDSIVVAAPYSHDACNRVLEACKSLQLIGLEHAILLRGAISYGQHDSDPDLLYSEALVNAYNLENGQARYPRILVDLNLASLFRGTDPSATCFAHFRELLLQDRDGQYFVDFAKGYDTRQLQGKIDTLKASADLRNASVFEKYDWLARYLALCHSRAGTSGDLGMPVMCDIP